MLVEAQQRPRVGQQHAGVEHEGAAVGLAARGLVATDGLAPRCSAAGQRRARAAMRPRCVSRGRARLAGDSVGAGTGSRERTGAGPPLDAATAPVGPPGRLGRVPAASLDGTAVSARTTAARTPTASGRSTPDSACDDRRSAAEAAVPVGVVAQGPQEVDLAEVRPVGLAEVELRVGALPEQEAGQPLLAAACGSPGRGRAGPWCRGARRCARRRGPRRAPRSRCPGRRARAAASGRRRRSPPPAVADGDVDEHARRRRAVPSSASLSARGVAVGQQVERTDRVDPPAAGLRRGRATVVLDDRAAAGPARPPGARQVVGREQPQRDDLDAGLLAPAEEVARSCRRRPVAVRGRARRTPGPSAGCRRG